MSLKVVHHRRCRPTAQILMSLLRQEGSGSHPEREGLVMWGLPYDGPQRALNAKAGLLDKFEQTRKLHDSGVRVPPFTTGIPTQYPAFGRKFSHTGGTDIRVVFGPEDLADARAAGTQYYSARIASQAEYRVWIYRRRHLGTYVKHLARPDLYRGLGRNYDAGWSFRLVPQSQLRAEAIELAAKAVTALDLDFGAVDMLLGTNGHFYVLEVNTAPGVEGPDRQAIRLLAKRIAKWNQLGFPERRGA